MLISYSGYITKPILTWPQYNQRAPRSLLPCIGLCAAGADAGYREVWAGPRHAAIFPADLQGGGNQWPLAGEFSLPWHQDGSIVARWEVHPTDTPCCLTLETVEWDLGVIRLKAWRRKVGSFLKGWLFTFLGGRRCIIVRIRFGLILIFLYL